MDKNLSQKIKGFRKRSGITLSVLADMVGCSRQYLTGLESGKKTPSPKLLKNIAIKLGLTREEASLIGAELDEYAMASDQNIINKVANMETKKEDKLVSQTSSEEIKGKQYKVPENLNILYSDDTFLTWNDFGIVFDFGQRLGPTNTVNVVSRVGMSVKHAKALFQLLETELKKMKE